MPVDDPTPHAHIDNAGMLRDIFAAMFPDLGDVQLERSLLKERERQVATLCLQGYTVSEISAEVGRSERIV